MQTANMDEIKERVNLNEKVGLALTYAAFSLIPALTLLGVSLWILGNVWWAIIIGLACLGGMTYELLTTKVKTSDLIVEDGCEGILYYEGNQTGDLLEHCNFPAAKKATIPILGKRELYDVEQVPSGIMKREHVLEGITTKGTAKVEGVRFKSPLDYRYYIHDKFGYAAKIRAQRAVRGTSVITPEENFESILNTIGKKVGDHFTYKQIDDSKPATGEKNPFKGKVFSKAILAEIKAGHGGIQCHCENIEDSAGNVIGEKIVIDELCMTIVNILPSSTLAENDKIIEQQEQQHIELLERNSERKQIETVAQLGAILRTGKIGGKSLYENEDDNPYKNMPVKELNATIERHLKIRSNPREFIITQNGGNGGNGGLPPALTAWLVQQMQNNP